MKEEFVIEEVEFNEELYQKNLEENDFSNRDIDGRGDVNADN